MTEFQALPDGYTPARPQWIRYPFGIWDWSRDLYVWAWRLRMRLLAAWRALRGEPVVANCRIVGGIGLPPSSVPVAIYNCLFTSDDPDFGEVLEAVDDVDGAFDAIVAILNEDHDG